jgi:4-hydroxy-3-methylbut-2-en-1-yl diphosphate reductase
MLVNIIKPYGFCGGVKRAIKLALLLRNKRPNNKITCLGPIVHNDDANNLLRDNKIDIIDGTSADFINYLKIIEKGEIIILSAHGHSADVQEYLEDNKIEFYDAICPFLRDTKNLIEQNSKKANINVFVGNPLHIETTSLTSYDKNFIVINDNNLSDVEKCKNKTVNLFTQSTVSNITYSMVFEQLNLVAKHINEFRRICNEPIHRFNKLCNEGLKHKYDAILVVGSNSSSNANLLLKMYYITTKQDKCFLVSNLNEVKKLLETHKIKRILIASATSTPSSIVDEISCYLSNIK